MLTLAIILSVLLVFVLPIAVLFWMVNDVFEADEWDPDIPDEALVRLLQDLTDGSYTAQRIDKGTY